MNAPKPAQRSTRDSSAARHRFAGAEPPVVPDYELIRRIGGGSYGEVWLARSATGVMRALKIVHRSTFEDDRPFQREFEGIQRFERISREHPGQLALFHIGRNESAGYFYYVMELADDNVGQASSLPVQRASVLADRNAKLEASPPAGGDARRYTPHTLRADLEQGRLPAARVLEIGLALTEALAHLHSHGLVHRDVKPSNVIFVNGRPKLADIGLVTDASDQCSIVGTEGYLPPEGPGTPQADIFALGKVLYEAATGMDRRSFPDLPADMKVWPEAESVLEMNQVVLRACAADLRARYQSAEELHRDLLQLKESKSLVQMRRRERRWHSLRRGAAWVGAAAAAVCLLALMDRVLWRRDAVRPSQRSLEAPAHPFYTLGRNYLDRFLTAADVRLAAENFERSIQAEPAFAPAYGCLAYTYTIWTTDGWNPSWKDLAKAQEYAIEGLKRGDMAEAHLALAWYEAIGEWRWQEAKREFEKALGLQPSSALCRMPYAEYLRVIGRADDGLKELKVAMGIEPHPKFADFRLPFFLADARHFDEALAAIEQSRSLMPSEIAFSAERNVLCALDRYPDAIELERKWRVSLGEPEEAVGRELGDWKKAVARDGPKAYWRVWINRTQGYEQACCYARSDQPDKALRLLEEARNRKDRLMTIHIKTDWRLDPVRSEPRFQNILRAMNLP